jgi:cyclopropane-fatty-acyl-phospholipid synthase
MDRVLKVVLSRIIRSGDLEVVTARGTVLRFGDRTAPSVRIRFTDRKAEIAFLADPEIHVGELYTDGRLLVERGTIYDFLYVALRSTGGNRLTPLTSMLQSLRVAIRKFSRLNSPRRSKSNVAHHYDLDSRLYRLFLDEDLQYSCAYFEHPGVSLDEAQLAKKRHIAAKLDIGPGASVLDIGCGWGGMALYLAQTAGAGEVLGITLSEEQIHVAQARARDRGVAEQVRFALKDYRLLEGRFDRIVSVGMFEHVGVHFYEAYFEACRRLLRDDGIMLLHTIGFTDVPQFGAPWIEKYIFPGGYIPALSQIVPAIEKAGLVVSDIEVLQVHYAETLKRWRERFMARWDDAEKLYDERFCRMWEFYLAASEAAFRCERMAVFQIQVMPQPAKMPTTRLAMFEREEVLRLKEAAHDGRAASRRSAG